MSAQREQAIAAAFVSISNTLVDEFDVVELFTSLTGSCADLLDVDSAGLLLADTRRVLHVVAASSERTRALELFQLQREQGPCLDCFHTGSPVLVADLAAEASRWPDFAVAALRAGFLSVHALPLRLRDNVLGTLGLFGSLPGALSDEDQRLAQALAHVASVALITERAAADQAAINSQLQSALESRVVIEQAKGLLAQSAGIEMDEAFAALRRYTRARGERLSDTARMLVQRELEPDVVMNAATQGRP